MTNVIIGVLMENSNNVSFHIAHMLRSVRWKLYLSMYQWFNGVIRTYGQIIKTVREPRISRILYTTNRFWGYINVRNLIGDNNKMTVSLNGVTISCRVNEVLWCASVSG